MFSADYNTLFITYNNHIFPPTCIFLRPQMLGLRFALHHDARFPDQIILYILLTMHGSVSLNHASSFARGHYSTPIHTIHLQSAFGADGHVNFATAVSIKVVTSNEPLSGAFTTPAFSSKLPTRTMSTCHYLVQYGAYFSVSVMTFSGMLLQSLG